MIQLRLLKSIGQTIYPKMPNIEQVFSSSQASSYSARMVEVQRHHLFNLQCGPAWISSVEPYCYCGYIIMQSHTNPDLTKQLFQHWKEHSQRYKKKVASLIRAYQFRYKSLYAKTFKALSRSSRLYYKQVKWNHFKRKVVQITKEVDQSGHLVRTLRQRRIIKSWILIHRQRRLQKYHLAVGGRFRDHMLKTRVFGLIKIGSVLFSLGQRHKRLQSSECKIRFFKCLTVSHLQSLNKRMTFKGLQTTRNKKMLSNCFDQWRFSKIQVKYQKLVAYLQSKHFWSFSVLTGQSIKVQLSLVARYKTNLLRKCFNALTHNAILLKVSKYHKYQLVLNSFTSWKSLLLKERRLDESVPPELLTTLKQAHHQHLKRRWFDRMYSIYSKKVNSESKSAAIRQYYRLKTEQILYKNCFQAFRENLRLSRAQRHSRVVVLRRGLSGFQVAIKDREQGKHLLQRSLKFSRHNLLRKGLQVLSTAAKKSRVAKKWRSYYVLKRCLQRWVQTTVSHYLQSQTKAQQFYRTGLLFKVLVGFRQTLDESHNIIAVLKARLRTCLRRWRRQTRTTVLLHRRQLCTKAMIFRGWKFYVKY